MYICYWHFNARAQVSRNLPRKNKILLKAKKLQLHKTRNSNKSPCKLQHSI